MPTSKRYFADVGPEEGITPSQLRRLGRDKQIEYLLAWFGHYYEDPTQNTPYETAEGGYLYIWGGPYDAREELWIEFAGIVSEARINEAAEEIESDGSTDWAPSHFHSDHARDGEDDFTASDTATVQSLDAIVALIKEGVTLNYGDPAELELRREALEQASQFESALRDIAVDYPGIGHNQPPNDDNELDRQIGAINAAREVEAIKAGLAGITPDGVAVAESALRISMWRDYVAKKADKFVDKFVETLGVASATAVVGAMLVVPFSLS
jgi:hypothetical protein